MRRVLFERVVEPMLFSRRRLRPVGVAFIPEDPAGIILALKDEYSLSRYVKNVDFRRRRARRNVDVAQNPTGMSVTIELPQNLDGQSLSVPPDKFRRRRKVEKNAEKLF